jgi:hypothetical protein
LDAELVEPACDLLGLGAQLVSREMTVTRPENDRRTSLEQLDGQDP